MRLSAIAQGARTLAASLLVLSIPLLCSPAYSQSTPEPTTTTPAPAATPEASPSPAQTPPPAAQATPEPSPTPAVPEGAATGQTLDLTSRPAAYIEGKAKREEVYGAIMDNLAKIRAAAGKAGLKTVGHAMAVFLAADDDGFTYRADGAARKRAGPARAFADPIKLGQTPVGKAMKFEHRGEYDDINSTYDAITAYLDEKSVDAQDVFLEEYLNEPKTPDDPTGQVDIYVLIR